MSTLYIWGPKQAKHWHNKVENINGSLLGTLNRCNIPMDGMPSVKVDKNFLEKFNVQKELYEDIEILIHMTQYNYILGLINSISSKFKSETDRRYLRQMVDNLSIEDEVKALTGQLASSPASQLANKLAEQMKLQVIEQEKLEDKIDELEEINTKLRDQISSLKYKYNPEITKLTDQIVSLKRQHEIDVEKIKAKFEQQKQIQKQDTSASDCQILQGEIERLKKESNAKADEVVQKIKNYNQLNTKYSDLQKKSLSVIKQKDDEISKLQIHISKIEKSSIESFIPQTTQISSEDKNCIENLRNEIKELKQHHQQPEIDKANYEVKIQREVQKSEQYQKLIQIEKQNNEQLQKSIQKLVDKNKGQKQNYEKLCKTYNKLDEENNDIKSQFRQSCDEILLLKAKLNSLLTSKT